MLIIGESQSIDIDLISALSQDQLSRAAIQYPEVITSLPDLSRSVREAGAHHSPNAEDGADEQVDIDVGRAVQRSRTSRLAVLPGVNFSFFL
jgi:hypothetical protein